MDHILYFAHQGALPVLSCYYVHLHASRQSGSHAVGCYANVRWTVQWAAVTVHGHAQSTPVIRPLAVLPLLKRRSLIAWDVFT